MNSPTLKNYGIERIMAGERCLVVDLGGCSGMDSTFMGTLAGMATRLSTHPGAMLQIADVTPRNRNSLEDLGLDFLMEINPPEPTWLKRIDSIRADLKPLDALPAQAPVKRALHVLEAHQILSDANRKNAHTFSDVVTLLESELAAKQKRSESPPKS